MNQVEIKTERSVKSEAKSQKSSSSYNAPEDLFADPPALEELLDRTWRKKLREVSALPKMTKKDFKSYNDLPLARIKRIMKSDEEVDMISAEAPMLFAKACEMFITDVSARASFEADCEGRTNIEREDFLSVYSKSRKFDFLCESIMQGDVEQVAESESEDDGADHENTSDKPKRRLSQAGASETKRRKA